MSVTSSTSTSSALIQPSQSPTTTNSSRKRSITGKRTNSLGWAKSDCHTCSSLGRHCDRRRPRCSACLNDGVICAGYVQQLDWERATRRLKKSRAKNSRTHTKPEPNSSATEATAPLQCSARLPTPSSFVFVEQHVPASRAVKRASRNSARSPKTPSATDAKSRSSSISTAMSIPTPPSPSWAYDPNTPASPFCSSLLPTTSVTVNTRLDHYNRSVFCTSIPPQIGRHPDDFEYALAFYDSFFSYITLTYAVPVNPWQAALAHMKDDIPCVRDAAVALSRRQQAHLRSRPEGLSVLQLKTRALSVFATHLTDIPLESGISTSLLLIALDYTESGVSNWTIHLRGAFRILESNGGIRVAESRPHLRSQIAMLIWYDVTAALISRCGPVFPRSYLEALMLWQSESEWSILALNGLPDEMFLDMHQLAVAAARPETFSPEKISELECRIWNAQIIMHEDEQLALMSRAWRAALLLYIARVFPRPDAQPCSSLELNSPTTPALNPHDLALEVLRTTEAIPAHSNYQKQCFMPVMLSACELTSADVQQRKFVLDFGERWKRRTGIWIFNAGLEFMAGVWERNQYIKSTPRHRCSIDQMGTDGLNDADNDLEHSVDASQTLEESIEVPWTEVFPRGVEHGFLFG
ncbi:hypothetical protein ABEF92_003230 [Exophiala dermatitidis]|uniref:Zn(2)-C6 fungal-type domain-containing protein n=1 Tax=Exophiala dermatitidis (strain ATCC 34100 / CBS 525.76 / NIH/UT8656) TaxID=858893 RepID=H6BVA0_EXODN|nr:uncharacterized protein HMPREF1120_03172 [Exophiala dermatitidis NIH/UT8656]EHY55014.1 hypothetical protein HMPREF1120_03172 [Exophiala dermatitidis NIH/UT8656]